MSENISVTIEYDKYCESFKLKILRFVLNLLNFKCRGSVTGDAKVHSEYYTNRKYKLVEFE